MHLFGILYVNIFPLNYIKVREILIPQFCLLDLIIWFAYSREVKDNVSSVEQRFKRSSSQKWPAARKFSDDVGFYFIISQHR